MEHLVTVTNSELDSIHQWTISNRLSLNVNKTFAMTFSNRLHDVSDYHVKLNNVTIEHCTNGIFLGVIVDNSLKFDHYIDEICSKLSISVGIINRFKHNVPSEILNNLY